MLRPLAALFVLGLLSACTAPRNVVVLLEDDKPGAVVVTTDGGRRVLDQPGDAARMPARSRAPEADSLSRADIEREWSEAIAFHPPRPVTFILYFILDTTSLTPASRAELPKVLQLIRERPAPEVAIVGYTDRSGAADYNNQLGLRRAEAVRREVEAIGVPSALITVASYGASNPLVPSAAPYEPRNRRVEITVR